jgi:hypothetical protein
VERNLKLAVSQISVKSLNRYVRFLISGVAAVLGCGSVCEGLVQRKVVDRSAEKVLFSRRFEAVALLIP